jgi:hypothetical protein
MTTHDPATSAWHLDKRVNLSIIIALVFQAAVFSFWVGVLSQRVDSHDIWIAANIRSDARLSVVEAQINAMQSTLLRIEGRMDGSYPRTPQGGFYDRPQDWRPDGGKP